MKKPFVLITLILSIGLIWGYTFLPSFATLAPLEASIAEDIPELLELYKHLHSHPELFLQEEKTSERMAQELRSSGFEVTEQIGGKGVVGIYRNGEGPTVMIRTDMDALPILEKTELPYASQVEMENLEGKIFPVMHACGHDMHMSVWTGTARSLVRLRDQWQGTLMMIAQPAEEIGAGAKAMLKDGLYTRFGVPDYALALHVNATLPAGKVGVHEGFALANVDRVAITLYGIGAHGAAPHESLDPAVLAASVVMDLQTVVSRNVPPTEAAVVTVGSMHVGTRDNIISDFAELKLTVRTYKPEVRELVLRGIERIALGNAIAMGVSEDKLPKVDIAPDHTPAVYNHPELQARVNQSIGRAIGQENLVAADAYMVGEDFSRYGHTPEQVPSILFWLGAVAQEKIDAYQAEGKRLPGLHSPFFYPEPELTLRTGIKAMSTSAMDLMPKP